VRSASSSRKKAPSAPALDGALARRIPLRLLLAMAIQSTRSRRAFCKSSAIAPTSPTMASKSCTLQQGAYDVVFRRADAEMDGLEAARQGQALAARTPCIIAMTGKR
jgi:hypothetical protein